MARTLKTVLMLALLTSAFGALFGIQIWQTRHALRDASHAQGVIVVWNEPQSGYDHEAEPRRLLVHGDAVSWFRLNYYGPLLRDELAIYPPGLLGKLGLGRLLLAERLEDERGLRIGGMDWSPKVIFLEACGSEVPRYSSAIAIHHEIYHSIERWGYGVDKEWAQGTTYVGSAKVQAPWDGPSLTPGFIDNYSRSCPGEDKAQVYAHLMVRYLALAHLAAKDKLLARKVQLMKQRLAALDPAFDEVFWQRQGERPMANGEWVWETEGERLRLEPPHPPYHPLERTEVAIPVGTSAEGRERRVRESRELRPPAAPL